MTSKNIPVIILNEVILFPSTDIRLDFDGSYIKNILDISEKYFDSKVLIAFKEDPLEENTTINELLRVGVIANISKELELPDKKIRVSLKGVKRAKINSLYEEEFILHAKVKTMLSVEVEAKEEIAYVRMLKKLLNDYINNSPFTPNHVFNVVKNINDLDTLTNILSFILDLPNARKQEYLQEVNQVERSKMLIKDIRQDFEILSLEKEIDEEVERRMSKTEEEFILREKIKVIKERLGESNTSDVDYYKNRLLEINCPKKTEDKIKSEIAKLDNVQITSPEASVIKNYLDLMLSLPYNKTTQDERDLTVIKKKLSKNHYALDLVKERILEYITVKNYTNDVESPILCFVGPPGVGKTTLAKSIAEALNRKYVKYSVGGVNDSSEIVGHRRTYVGAYPGMIIQGIKKAGVNNPVFLIDEIDKMQRGINGDPASSLLEVLDRSQNKKFVDLYVEEEYDLGNVMFIVTANYIDRIPIELLDRLEIIELSSYTMFEKKEILKNYAIPNFLKKYNLSKKEIIFSDDVLFYLIDNYTYEAGVREAERLILKILRKYINDKLVNKQKELVITKDNIKNYLGNEIKINENDDDVYSVGVVNGLSYTIYGGDTLKIEATMYKGSGNLILTGSLGEVMRESAIVCLSYIRSNADLFNIKKDVLSKNDIHIHLEEGAIKKEGPSAGIALTTVLISTLTGKAVPNYVAMTGEMTLRGKVLPVGGIREKVIGAYKKHIKKIFIPLNNKKDILDLNIKEINEIEFVYVNNYIDIYKELFKDKVIDFTRDIEFIKFDI